MTIRARFNVTQINKYDWMKDGVEVFLKADTNAEHGDWSKYTPSGEMKIMITNPVASEQFNIGDSFYLDFTKV